MTRIDGRSPGDLRRVRIETGALAYAEGSALISTGDTRVLCAVSVEEGVPRFLRGRSQGWLTAEYAMLPRSTLTRTPRSASSGGRAREIQRLIGRSLRAVVDLRALGERTLTVDCDVLQADGGTRTAAITGAYVAVRQALDGMDARGELSGSPLRAALAATSVGVVAGEVLLDLCYEEDSSAEVDVNIVMTDAGDFVEVQGTAEGAPFSRATLDSMLALGKRGIDSLLAAQREALGR